MGQFQEAVGPWIFDLYTSYPHLLAGRAYWCITPLAPREKETAGAIPIGMEEDAAYFGGLLSSDAQFAASHAQSRWLK